MMRLILLACSLIGCVSPVNPSATGFKISMEQRTDGETGTLADHWCLNDFKSQFEAAADVWTSFGGAPAYLWRTPEINFRGLVFSINLGLKNHNQFLGATIGGQGHIGTIEFKESIVCNTDPRLTRHIIAHEVGHAFGLGHTKTGIMAAFSNATEFSSDDHEEWQRIYGD